MEVVRFLNEFAAGIGAGGMSLTAAATAAKERLPDRERVQDHVEGSRVIDRFMPPAIMISAITAIVALLWEDHLTAASRDWLVVGLVCSLLVSIPSVAINLRINAFIESEYKAGTPPSELRPKLARWNRVHLFRTIAGTLGFAAYTISLLVRA